MFQATMPPRSGDTHPPTTTHAPGRRARRARPLYFGPRHPLAQVARRHCRTHHASSQPTRQVGGIACGACWEHAIRTDERFVIECDLDDEPDVSDDHIDEIAVAYAVAGRKVTLTTAERDAAIRLLGGRQVPVTRISRLLRVNPRTVTHALYTPPKTPDPSAADQTPVPWSTTP
jgi:hypothetical protein